MTESLAWKRTEPNRMVSVAGTLEWETREGRWWFLPAHGGDRLGPFFTVMTAKVVAERVYSKSKATGVGADRP